MNKHETCPCRFLSVCGSILCPLHVENKFMNQDTLKTAASFLPIITPFVSALIETRVKPKLQELFKNRDLDGALLEEAGASKFGEYLQRAYEQNSVLTVLVFPGIPKELKKLYVPITLVGRQTIGWTIEETGEVVFTKDIKVDTYPQFLIPRHRKVLITDTAGMGKSTLLKFLFLECIDNNEGIPVLIELRRVTRETPILKLICDQLNAIDEGFDEGLILKLIKRGDFVFLFDGFDEIPLTNREFVTSHLQDFIAKTASNYFVITSRPDPSLVSFSDFNGFRIKPLSRREAYELIVRYDEAGAHAGKLIQYLESDDVLDEIEDFLSNPLLVSLLYAYYEYSPQLSSKKYLFYRQIYDALFSIHDESKHGVPREKRSRLESDHFEALLRCLAYLTFKNSETEYDKDSILARMRAVKNIYPYIIFNESDLLHDLVLNVPIFARDGIYYKWQHKLLQEYFAARFILEEGRETISDLLTKIYRSDKVERCSNLFSLLYDMNTVLFRKTLGRVVASEFVSFCSSRVQTIDNDFAPEAAIKLRKELSFLASVFFLATPENRTAQWVGELNKENLNWSTNAKSSVFKPALDHTGLSLDQFKFNIFNLDEMFLQSAAHLSKPAYIVFSILVERKDPLVKKIACDELMKLTAPALQMFHTKDNILFGTDEKYPHTVTDSAERFLATNSIMILALRDYIHDYVLDLDECLSLLAQPEISGEENDFMFTGW